jgi:hypothetical protein
MFGRTSFSTTFDGMIAGLAAAGVGFATVFVGVGLGGGATVVGGMDGVGDAVGLASGVDAYTDGIGAAAGFPCAHPTITNAQANSGMRATRRWIARPAIE